MSDLQLVKKPGEDEPKKLKTPSKALTRPESTQLAREIIRQSNGKLAFLHGNWHIYSGGYWRKVSEHKIHLDTMLYLEKRKHRTFPITTALVKNVVEMMKWLLAIEDDDILQKMAAGRHYLNFRNGLYNLKTCRLEAHQPNLYFTRQFNFDYDEDAPYDLWQKFITTSLVLPKTKKTDWESVNLLQEFFGYCMTPEVDLKKMLFLDGLPESGKSTAVAMLHAILGDLAGTINLNTLKDDKFATAMLAGKYVVTCTEADANTYLADGLIKNLVGGEDKIIIHQKYKDSYEIQNMAKAVWAMNNAPRTKDNSGAIANRLLVVRFNRQFLPGDPDRIENLGAKLRNEVAGIFNWAMVGLQRLRRAQHFTESVQSREFIEEYALKNDLVKQYLLDNTIADSKARTAGKELYKDYENWCFDNGVRPKGNSVFADDLRRLGYEKTRSDGHSYWHGLKLRYPKISLL